MKLEFEPNIASLPFVDQTNVDEMISDSDSPEVTKLLRDGIEAAQKGERAEARTLLLRVTEADANNENAWLWLASISEYPEELLVFLKNVLSINPDNERAIEWAKATESLMAKTFVQRGIDATKNEQKDSAKQCFLQAIVHDRNSELAWLWLASVSSTPEEKMSHLQKVLSINPHNENAISSLKNAKSQMAKVLLPKANQYAIQGKRVEAQKLLDEIVNDAPDFEDAWMLKAHLAESLEDKIGYFEQVLEVNSDNQVAKANLESLKMFVGDSYKDRGDDMADVDVAAVANATEVMNHDVAEVEISVEQEFQEEEVQFDEQSDENTVDDSENAEFESEGSESESFDFEDEPNLELSDHTEEQEYIEPIKEQFLEENQDLEVEDEASVEFSAETEVSYSSISDQPSHSEEVIEESFQMMESESFEPATEEYQETIVEDEPQAIEENFAEASEEYQVQSEETVEHTEFAAEEELVDSNKQEESSDEENAEMEMFMEEIETLENNSALENSEVGDTEFEQTSEETDVTAEADTDQPESAEFQDDPEKQIQLPESFKEKQLVELLTCPFCESDNEPQAFTCGECKTVLTLSDIEMLLSQENADTEVVKSTLKKLEDDKESIGVSLEELKVMGIGYINLKVFRKGFEYLKEASQCDQNDVMLISQLDALALRINEIEEQAKDFDAQPKSKTILVVDDSPTVRKLISGKLEKCGHEAVCAVDGMDALAKINEVIPDLILLDITMPRMDGYQVCKLIRGNDATKNVPIIMISGKDGFFDKVRGKMAGTDNYITKPFGPETLMKTVNEYIS